MSSTELTATAAADTAADTTPDTTIESGAQSADTRGITIASFVLGIASMVAGWTFFAPLVGLIMGIMALRRGTPDRSLAVWGVVLNSVALVFALILTGFLLFAALLGLFVVPFTEV